VELSLLMDALKKAENDKHKEAQPEVSQVTEEAASPENLTLELTDHKNEFADLPESDVVDDPALTAMLSEDPPQELALEVDELQPAEAIKPAPLPVKKLQRGINKQRYYIIAVSLTAIVALITGYYFWQLSTLQKPAIYTQSEELMADIPAEAGIQNNTLQVQNKPQAVPVTEPPQNSTIRRAEPVLSQETVTLEDTAPSVNTNPITIKKIQNFCSRPMRHTVLEIIRSPNYSIKRFYGPYLATVMRS
jgi:hypothetical protein